MSRAIENLQAALNQAIASRPKIGGFPHLAETLRRAGVMRNLWFLPACQSLYLTSEGPVMSEALGLSLVSGMADVPVFNREALIGRCGSIKLGRAHFRSFWGLAGAPELCVTMSISWQERLHTMVAMMRRMWKHIRPWRRRIKRRGGADRNQERVRDGVLLRDGGRGLEGDLRD